MTCPINLILLLISIIILSIIKSYDTTKVLFALELLRDEIPPKLLDSP